MVIDTFKKELKISIEHNWYCDSYPTWCGYASYSVGNWAYRNFGHIGSIFFVLIQTPLHKCRTFEIFFYRRKQLDYYAD